jgi:hypothetical protein
VNDGREAPKPEGERPPSRSSFGPGARYSALVGLAFIGLIAVAAYNAAQTNEGSLLGTENERGAPLAEFAVPDIRGQLDLDANIAQDDCETSRNPCPADERREPACDIQSKGAIRVCDLFDRPLVLSFWFENPQACVETQDEIYDLADDFGPRVNFLSVAIRGERSDVEAIVDERGWKVPVGWDRDGAVSNVYRVGVCPTVAIARPGGIYDSVLIGEAASAASVRERVAKALRWPADGEDQTAGEEEG